MRVTPLAIFASALEPIDMLAAISADAEMTHPNKLVHEAIFVYTYAISFLVNNPALPGRS
jgi:ADP-ribosylglycohydrolase